MRIVGKVCEFVCGSKYFKVVSGNLKDIPLIRCSFSSEKRPLNISILCEHINTTHTLTHLA